MAHSLTLIYDLPPKPAPRPRLSRFGTYNEPKYTAYKKEIQRLTGRIEKLQGALKMQVLFQFKKPKSWTKKKKREAYWHTQTPDTDNLVKAVKDALNGLAYKDDSQVCDLDAMKIWGEENKIIVELEEI